MDKSDIHVKIWGMNGWMMIEYILNGYGDCPTYQDKFEMKIFLLNLRYILLCRKNRIFYDEYIDSSPITDQVLSCKQCVYDWLMKFKVNGK